MKEVLRHSEIAQKLRSAELKTDPILCAVISLHAMETVKALMADTPVCGVASDTSVINFIILD
jgi:hypothetical protein